MHGSDAVFPTMWLRSATTTVALVDLNCRLRIAILLSVVWNRTWSIPGLIVSNKLHTRNIFLSSALDGVRALVSCVAAVQADDIRKAEVRNETCVEQAPYPHNQGAISVACLP